MVRRRGEPAFHQPWTAGSDRGVLGQRVREARTRGGQREDRRDRKEDSGRLLKSAGRGNGRRSSDRSGSGEPERDAQLDPSYWLNIWAFGTAAPPYGLGLTADQLWDLSDREYEALTEQREIGLRYQLSLVAALRADLYNTSAREFKQHFEPADFMPVEGPSRDMEARVLALIDEGYTPSQAAAIASSKHTKEHNLYSIDSAVRGLNRKGKRRA